ncbi:MAG: hypothetical protein WCP53_10025 [Verrucomicrobiota bacterium]
MARFAGPLYAYFDIQPNSPADTSYALTWTLPDAGSNLESGPGLASGLFIDVTARSGPIPIGTCKVGLVSGADLPAANRGFFRLRQL